MNKFNKNMAINAFGERYQKEYGYNPDFDEMLVIERIGGMDNAPKFKASFEFEGRSSTYSGYCKKKEVKKNVVLLWLEENTFDVFGY